MIRIIMDINTDIVVEEETCRKPAALLGLSNWYVKIYTVAALNKLYQTQTT